MRPSPESGCNFQNRAGWQTIANPRRNCAGPLRSRTAPRCGPFLARLFPVVLHQVVEQQQPSLTIVNAGSISPAAPAHCRGARGNSFAWHAAENSMVSTLALPLLTRYKRLRAPVSAASNQQPEQFRDLGIATAFDVIAHEQREALLPLYNPLSARDQML